MSDFFEPPPPPPEPPREHRQPEWFGPPENVFGVVVPQDLTLARTDDVALVLRSITAYPAGAQFDIPLLLRKQVSDPLGFMPFHRRMRGGEIADDVLRLGVQFADGSKATNMAQPFRRANPEEQPESPVLMPRGGGGGGRRWDVSFWLWPLPKGDPFTLVVEWPAHGIELTRHEIAVRPLLEASSRCEELWPGGGSGDEGTTQFLLLEGP